MWIRLKIESPDDTSDLLDFELSGPISLGRDIACNVVLPSPDVSRQHIVLWPSKNAIEIEDSSSNGSWLNSVKFHKERVSLEGKGIVRIGPYLIEITSSSDKKTSRRRLDSSSSFRVGSGLIPITSGATRAVSSNTLHPFEATREIDPAFRRRIHRMLLERLDLASHGSKVANDRELRLQVRAALLKLISEHREQLPAGCNTEKLADEITDEALGLGPLEALLADSTVSEIMVVDSETIFVERYGRIERSHQRFTDEEAVRSVIERIITPLGRRIDESNPLVDARLKDGSRVNAIIRPLAIKGAAITIRKFSKALFSIDQLVQTSSLSEAMAQFLVRSVKAKKNIIIAGGTGSGKTTLLNVLSSVIPEDERIVTIEDSAELQLPQQHVVPLESKMANLERQGEFTIRDLLKNALRMRPDRIVVGECRGGEALDMLQAMNTGHEGSLTTIHANSPAEAVSRLETLVLMSGIELPVRAIREQIAGSIDLIVHQARLSDGSRRVLGIAEVGAVSEDGTVSIRDIFEFHRSGIDSEGRILGSYETTGYLPTFLAEFESLGLVTNGHYL
ncbi:MAG: Flp pilus assembly complex ATPase component TadA [Myxococcales bacterium]|nr:MAG: Flp pilus assembly complex ATPase component TadA [Myxococcales bacterium]